MHAMVIHAEIQDRAEAKRALDEDLIPMLRTAPGFVGAYYVAFDDASGISVTVFETEEQARAVAPTDDRRVGGASAGSLQFGEVLSVA